MARQHQNSLSNYWTVQCEKQNFCDGSGLSAAFVLFLYFSLEVAVVTFEVGGFH